MQIFRACAFLTRRFVLVASLRPLTFSPPHVVEAEQEHRVVVVDGGADVIDQVLLALAGSLAGLREVDLLYSLGSRHICMLQRRREGEGGRRTEGKRGRAKAWG